MKLEIDIPSILYQDAKENRNYISVTKLEIAWKAIADGKPLEQEPFINKPCVSSEVCEYDKNKVLDKIRSEILDCLKALDEIEKSGLNIYLPNEISGRRLTYQQCLKFIDKYKTESEDKK